MRAIVYSEKGPSGGMRHVGRMRHIGRPAPEHGAVGRILIAAGRLAERMRSR